MKNLGTIIYIFITLCCSNELFAQPANDNLANAIDLSTSTFPISDDVIAADAQLATVETNEVVCKEANESWWYVFNPSITTEYIIKTEVTGSDAEDPTDDLRLGIYKGTGHPLTEVGCFDNDGGDGYGEDELLTLSSDTTYYIRISPIAPSAIMENVTTTINVFNTWDGSESDDWNDAANWSLNAVPSATSLVQILGTIPNEPVVKNGVNATASFMAIFSGIDLTIDEGGTLTIAGNESDGILVNDVNSVLAVNGSLNISNSEGDAIDINNGTLNVGTNGEITVMNTGNGIEIECTNTSTIEGKVSLSNITEDALIIKEEVILNINENAEVDISSVGDDGVVLQGDVQLNINGKLTIDQVTDHGIDVDYGYVNVGSTGVLNISEVGDNGVNDIVGTNAGQITISEVTDEAFNTGGSTFTNESTGVIDLSNSGEDCIDVGTTIENNGTVIANHCGANAITGETFNNNANATLRADGIITSSSTVFASSSILEPGTSPGCITFTQGEDLSGATLNFEIDGTAACTDYDQITVSDVVTLTGATLNLSGSHTPLANETFTLINNNSDSGVVGNFAALTEGSSILFNNVILNISYVGGSGNDVVLTVSTLDIPLSPKVFLQGPFASSNMNTNLKDLNDFPTTMDTYTIADGVLDNTGDDAIVDWVTVELRDANDNSTVLSSRPALLKANGEIVDMDGTSPIQFTDVTVIRAYVAILHRNHLGIMTAAAVDLGVLN